MTEQELTIVTLGLGPALTNSYLVGDVSTNQAVVIDPAWDGEVILAEAERRGWQVVGQWLTHAHFDHFGGAGAVAAGLEPAPPLALHPDDLPLYQANGGASFFGFNIPHGPTPDTELSHNQTLNLGSYEVQVRHAPGHSPGHVMFYFTAAGILFCGDVIFQHGIGRTDLPGGSYETLMESIRTQVLTLPDETRLLSGHGPETTVGQERKRNPFLMGDF